MTDVPSIKKMRTSLWHPRFKRANVGRPDRRRLKDKWRKPRGEDNKQREHRVDRGALPSSGYRTPRAVRGYHPCGLREVLVRNVRDLEKVGDGYAVRIASTVGRKKREEILAKAKEMNLKVLNG